jgi:hypothetical protein
MSNLQHSRMVFSARQPLPLLPLPLLPTVQRL